MPVIYKKLALISKIQVRFKTNSMLTIIILFSAVGVMTWPVTADDVNFRLYLNPETYQICKSDYIVNCNVNVSLPLILLTHGYLGSPTLDWLINAKNAYFYKGLYNVIIVDWSKLAQNLIYFQAAEDTELVGNITGEFIYKLHTVKCIPYERIHFVGHSLGAHVAGFTGKYVKLMYGVSFGRITGLDPAGIGFENKPLNKILYKDDASFVDVINTDVTVVGSNRSDHGMANFYPNGGARSQPGCSLTKRKRNVDTFTAVSCSHDRSHAFFVESIYSVKFIAKECASYEVFLSGDCDDNPVAVMGENIDIFTIGLYYLQTNAESPYAKGP